MCQSAAEGGKRCAAHTRPAYKAVIDTLKQAHTNPPTDTPDINTSAVINHATTPTGRQELINDTRDLEATYSASPSTNTGQETNRQNVLAGLHLALTQADIKNDIEEEARRRIRYATTGTHAEPATVSPPEPFEPRVTTVKLRRFSTQQDSKIEVDLKTTRRDNEWEVSHNGVTLGRVTKYEGTLATVHKRIRYTGKRRTLWASTGTGPNDRSIYEQTSRADAIRTLIRH